MVLPLDDQIINLARRRHVAAAFARCIELADQIARHIRECHHFPPDSGQKTLPLGLFEIGDVLQDFGAGADGGDTGQYLMHQLAQQRVGPQPVSIGIGIGHSAV